ncbi:hypothetical protein V5E97_26420 [Singulisphaera sp. Ch08]|uniref:Uncharacterized protein n=1 Tax=Singulisphaera sp. Ch08 TaxID=3120278 RepID=A0AAU7C9S7_9BACT
MADIRSPRVLYFKGFLFLCTGILASAILLAEHPSLKFASLLAVAVWAFARTYYFAFYVIEHYIDPGYRYQGLLSFARYLIQRRKRRWGAGEHPSEDA